MNKKGQVTIFIVIAVIIIVVILALFIKINNNNSKYNSIPQNVQPVYSFVENCIKTTGEDAIVYTSMHGGYSSEPSDKPLIKSEIPYYVYNKKNYMPNKSLIEDEVSNYLMSNLSGCINDFENLSDFEINATKSIVNTTINSNNVVFDVRYPISIQKDKFTYKLENFNGIEVLVRLNEIFNAANEITIDQLNHTGTLCITCISDIAIKHDLYVNLVDYGENNTIFILTDVNSKINNQNYTYIFANQYG